MLLYITLAGAAAFVLYFVLRQRALDNAPDQHHLASLMIAALTSGSGVEQRDIERWIADQGWSRARQSVRVHHALGLARGTIAPDHHPVLLELARRLTP